MAAGGDVTPVDAAVRAMMSARSSRSSSMIVAVGSLSTCRANASPGPSRSSCRQVSSKTKGRPVRRRARKASASSEAVSAHWASSSQTIPGGEPVAPAAAPSAIAATSRACAPGPSTSAGRPGASMAGSSRWSSVRTDGSRAWMRAADATSASADRSSSTMGPYAIARSMAWARAATTTPPSWRTASANASDSRVLPMPASPTRTTIRPASVAIERTAASCANVTSRPTSGRVRRSRHARRLARDQSLRPDHGRVADRLIPSGGLLERGHAELALERRHADPILAEGGGSIPMLREQVHEPDMGPLIERVQLDSAHGRGDGAGKVAGTGQGRREMVEDGGHRPLGRHGTTSTPVIEVGAVAQGEARQERAPGKVRGAREIAGHARPSQALDVLEVDPDGRAHEFDLRAIDAERAFPDRRPERRQRPTERTRGRPRRRHRARAGRRAHPGRTAADRPRARRGSPPPCACRRRSARRPPGSPVDPGGGCRDPVSIGSPRNGTHSDGHPVTFR